jgi:hypothetical protein
MRRPDCGEHLPGATEARHGPRPGPGDAPLYWKGLGTRTRYYTVLKNCSVFQYTTPSRTNGNRTVLRSEQTCAMQWTSTHTLNDRLSNSAQAQGRAGCGCGPHCRTVRRAANAPPAAPGVGVRTTCHCLLDFPRFSQDPNRNTILNRLVPLALRPRPVAVLLLGDRPRSRDRDLRHSRLDPHGNGPRPRGPQRTGSRPRRRRGAVRRCHGRCPVQKCHRTTQSRRTPHSYSGRITQKTHLIETNTVTHIKYHTHRIRCGDMYCTTEVRYAAPAT